MDNLAIDYYIGEIVIAFAWKAKRFQFADFLYLIHPHLHAVGYFLGRYANAVDVVNLKWLPILEGIENNISKLTYQRLSDKNWPSYLPVEIVTQRRNLRWNNSGPCIDHGEKRTFQDQAKNAFNKLPINIRSNETKIIFNRQARDFYKDKVLFRALSLKIALYNLLSIR